MAIKTSRILLGLVLAAFAGLLVFGGLVYRAVKVERVDQPEAVTRFEAARALFANQTPMIQIDPSGRPVAVPVQPQAPVRPLTRLEVLAYHASDGRLVTAHVPFWFFRLKRPAAQFAVRGTGLDLDDLHLTTEDLERHGPGLVLDQTRANGDRVLVWTE